MTDTRPQTAAPARDVEKEVDQALRDSEAIQKLITRMNGRVMHPRRKQRCAVTVRRYPVDIAYRYLRRFIGGVWCRGGYHVARPNFGSGIAFPRWVNDRAMKTKAQFT